MPLQYDLKAEWLETDGLGGFASGTVGGVRTRRYHALLLTATNPPGGRMVLVSGFDAWVETPAGTFSISSQEYAPGIVPPDQGLKPESFEPEPWPRWTYCLKDGTRVVHELFVRHGEPTVALTWKLAAPQAGVKLCVRPFLSVRDYHALHHENAAFRFEPQNINGRWIWRPYDGAPSIASVSNGTYTHAPHWYRNFLYEQEQRRGLDCTEDLAAPGVLSFDLSSGEAIWLLSAGDGGNLPAEKGIQVARGLETLRGAERTRRMEFDTPLDRAADAYFVRRGRGQTIVAGYPWFTDWGRDTFIALRGLCLATGRLTDARDILLEWAGAVSEGMLPNRFSDHGETPEYNAVDASLWYVIAVHEFLQALDATGQRLAPRDRKTLSTAVHAILDAAIAGTRYHIRVDADGLLAAGQPGVQLTWMDAKVGDWVVTPRIGKPVEVQALWLTALWTLHGESSDLKALFDRGRSSFETRFWNEAEGCLFDVIDADHVRGRNDAAVRPNQIFAVGGLPLALLGGARARKVVETVERRLLTPLGLRSLAPDDSQYRPRYAGGVVERDGAYHQGTVWPWLMGPFVEAWLRVNGNTTEARRKARERLLAPLHAHLQHAGIGHVSEVADGDSPHAPGGCPFQAWSLAELLRVERGVLRDHAPAPTAPRATARAQTTASRP